MISILAPSKTLDLTPAPDWVKGSEPLFFHDAQQIVSLLSAMRQQELAVLMQVSEAIAATNHARLQEWGEVTKPALWAYRGDVYKGMYADALTPADGDWADGHIRIMSGLYGMLRPRDEISPYRLEMKAKLPINGEKNLYEFWAERLARVLDDESDGTICILSSEEYAKPIIKYARSRIATPVFMDHKPNGRVGPVPIYSKMMRGVMAHWIIKNRIDSVGGLKQFAEHGYVYDAEKSRADEPVFIRSAPMKPLVF